VALVGEPLDHVVVLVGRHVAGRGDGLVDKEPLARVLVDHLEVAAVPQLLKVEIANAAAVLVHHVDRPAHAHHLAELGGQLGVPVFFRQRHVQLDDAFGVGDLGGHAHADGGGIVDLAVGGKHGQVFSNNLGPHVDRHLGAHRAVHRQKVRLVDVHDFFKLHKRAPKFIFFDGRFVH
jgi:hypothetical protein